MGEYFLFTFTGRAVGSGKQKMKVVQKYMFSIFRTLYLDLNLDFCALLTVTDSSWCVCPWSQNFCLNIINNANTQMCSLEMFSGLWIFHINVWNGNPVEQKTSLILKGKWLKFWQDWYTSSSLSRLWKFFQSWIRNSSLTVLHFWRMHGTDQTRQICSNFSKCNLSHANQPTDPFLPIQ